MAREVLNADGKGIDLKEEEYLRSLCREMDLSFSDCEKIYYSFEKATDYFTEKQEKRIVLIEVIALAISNDELNELEMKYIDKLVSIFGFSEVDKDNAMILVKNYMGIQKSIIDFVTTE